ncbi:hypothetical protein HN873_026820, partial [Arachis hypogaea]
MGSYGALLVDGLGDGILLEEPDKDFEFLRNISFNLLQGCRMRNTKTIAIMGCIVNGPREMADADFGSQGFDRYLTVRSNGGLNQMRTGHLHCNYADSRPKLVAGSAEGYYGHVDRKLREGRMNHPKGITFDDRGNIYIVDTMNMAIRKISDSGRHYVSYSH